MSSQQELIQRWDTFLKKIEICYLESLEQAEEACLAQLEETNYDYYTVFRAWTGMKAQINNIIPKIDETWQRKVLPKMREVDNGSYFYNEQSFKASKLSDALHEKMERFETILQGKLSQRFYDHAKQTVDKNFTCSQCGAPIQVVKDLFRAQYISCGACGSINTFKPETKFIQIGWNAIDNIVALQLLPLHDAMSRAIRNIQDVRKEHQTEEMWEAYKSAYFIYWETYFKERIKLKSDAEKRFKDDMQRKQKEYAEFENIQRYNKYGIS